MLPLRMAAVFACLSTVHQLALQAQTLDDWLLAAVAAAGTVAAGISVLTLSDITRARIKRLLNAVEFLVVVDLVVVTMGAVALYDVVRN
jgi:hypothetical protein